MASLIVFASLLELGLSLTACVYRCDPSWAGLDTGICYDGVCPSPDSSYVGDSVCWGLPFEPSPGDIELHDVVPFDSQDACDAYLDSWMSSSSPRGNLSAGGSDKTSYPDRGQMWSTTMGVLTKCASVPECQGLVKGMKGKEVQTCINKCTFEYGESQLEKWFCDCAADVVTGGLATFFCNSVLGVIMQPVNNFLNKYIEQPVIDAVTKVEDAVKNIGSKIAHFFHFGRGLVVV